MNVSLDEFAQILGSISSGDNNAQREALDFYEEKKKKCPLELINYCFQIANTPVDSDNISIIFQAFVLMNMTLHPSVTLMLSYIKNFWSETDEAFQKNILDLCIQSIQEDISPISDQAPLLIIRVLALSPGFCEYILTNLNVMFDIDNDSIKNRIFEFIVNLCAEDIDFDKDLLDPFNERAIALATNFPSISNQKLQINLLKVFDSLYTKDFDKYCNEECRNNYFSFLNSIMGNVNLETDMDIVVQVFDNVKTDFNRQYSCTEPDFSPITAFIQTAFESSNDIFILGALNMICEISIIEIDNFSKHNDQNLYYKKLDSFLTGMELKDLFFEKYQFPILVGPYHGYIQSFLKENEFVQTLFSWIVSIDDSKTECVDIDNIPDEDMPIEFKAATLLRLFLKLDQEYMLNLLEKCLSENIESTNWKQIMLNILILNSITSVTNSKTISIIERYKQYVFNILLTDQVDIIQEVALIFFSSVDPYLILKIKSEEYGNIIQLLRKMCFKNSILCSFALDVLYNIMKSQKLRSKDCNLYNQTNIELTSKLLSDIRGMEGSEESGLVKKSYTLEELLFNVIKDGKYDYQYIIDGKITVLNQLIEKVYFHELEATIDEKRELRGMLGSMINISKTIPVIFVYNGLELVQQIIAFLDRLDYIDEDLLELLIYNIQNIILKRRMDFYQKLIDIMNKCLNSQIPTLFSLGIILMTHIFKYFPQFESEHINERIECISNFFVEDKCMMGTYPKLINCLTNIISQNDLFTISANFNTNKLHQAAMKDFMEYQRKLKKKIEIRSKIVEIIGPNNYNYCYTNNEFPYKFLKMFPYANQVFIDKKHYSKKKSSTIHLPLINEETKSKNTNLMKLQKYFPFPFGTQTEKVIDFDDQVPIVEDPDVNRTVDVPPETIELLGSIYSEFFLIDFRKDTPESAEM